MDNKKHSNERDNAAWALTFLALSIIFAWLAIWLHA